MPMVRPVSFRIPVRWRYPFALGAFALSFLGRYLLDAWLGPDRGLILFVPAVAVTTFSAGLAPGIVSAVLSGVAISYFFLSPYHRFALDQEGVVSLASYVLVAAITIGLIHWLRVLIDRLEVARNRQQLLVSELQHRSQNLFTVIQSIALLTLVDGQPLSAARSAIFATSFRYFLRIYRIDFSRCPNPCTRFDPSAHAGSALRIMARRSWRSATRSPLFAPPLPRDRISLL
jgi:hypothetical protein